MHRQKKSEVKPIESRRNTRTPWLASGWARVKSFGLSRALLVAAGAAAVGIGLVNAVSSEASTAPLIVGAILVVAAVVIAPGWREIRARHGETEVSILRGVENRLEDVASESKTEEELRAEVAELKEDVQRAREAVERGEVASATETSGSRVYEAGHSFSDGKVLLTLEVPTTAGIVFDSYRCVVRNPDLKTASVGPFSAPYSIVPARRELTVVYPDDFRDAPPLMPGPYVAEWRRRNILSASIAALVGDPVVARDAWTINA